MDFRSWRSLRFERRIAAAMNGSRATSAQEFAYLPHERARCRRGWSVGSLTELPRHGRADQLPGPTALDREARAVELRHDLACHHVVPRAARVQHGIGLGVSAHGPSELAIYIRRYIAASDLTDERLRRPTSHRQP